MTIGRSAARLPVLRKLVFVAVAVLASCAPAEAQTQPRQVRMIVPFGAGGSADALARVLADELQRSTLFNPVVENLPGASGKIATETCSRAAADGRTVCIGMPSTHTIPLLSGSPESVAYLRKLVPIALIGTQSLVISVTPQIPARSAAGFLDWLRRNPDAAYSTSGIGTLSHLAVLAIASRLGVKPTHVPYRSGEASTLAAATRQVAFTVTQFASLRAYLGNARLIPVAVTGASRLPQLPEVATLAESMGAAMEFRTYIGLFAPEGVPEAFSRGLYETLREVASQPDARARLSNLGLETDVRPAADFAATLAREEALWRGVVRAHGLTLD